MRVKTVKLVGFKRFDNLTIDLGPTPKKNYCPCRSEWLWKEFYIRRF